MYRNFRPVPAGVLMLFAATGLYELHTLMEYASCGQSFADMVSLSA
jgi:hypothetical protein